MLPDVMSFLPYILQCTSFLKYRHFLTIAAKASLEKLFCFTHMNWIIIILSTCYCNDQFSKIKSQKFSQGIFVMPFS